jgi:hypothetical protein
MPVCFAHSAKFLHHSYDYLACHLIAVRAWTGRGAMAGSTLCLRVSN